MRGRGLLWPGLLSPLKRNLEVRGHQAAPEVRHHSQGEDRGCHARERHAQDAPQSTLHHKLADDFHGQGPPVLRI